MAWKYDKRVEARLRAISSTAGAVMSKPTGHLGGGKTPKAKGKAKLDRKLRELLRGLEEQRRTNRRLA